MDRPIDPVFAAESPMRIYQAGPLFTQAERDWNQRLAEALRGAGHDVTLPQAAVEALTMIDADTIFRLCVDGVRRADVVVAILDGADADSGTCFECGLAYAWGVPIVAVRTDFRGGGDALPGQALATVNLMLTQSARQVVARSSTHHDFKALAGAVLEALAQIEPETRTKGVADSEKRRRDA